MLLFAPRLGSAGVQPKTKLKQEGKEEKTNWTTALRYQRFPQVPPLFNWKL